MPVDRDNCIKIDLRRLIKRVNEKRGTPITQDELSAKTGITTTTVGTWHNGYVRRIDLTYVFAWLKFFRTELEDDNITILDMLTEYVDGTERSYIVSRRPHSDS